MATKELRLVLTVKDFDRATAFFRDPWAYRCVGNCSEDLSPSRSLPGRTMAVVWCSSMPEQLEHADGLVADREGDRHIALHLSQNTNKFHVRQTLEKARLPSRSERASRAGRRR